MIFTSSAVWCIPSRLVLPLFIGLPFVNLVTGGRLFSQCVDLPIHVDVDIQPSNHTAPVRCNHEQEFVLRRHIEKVVAKKFRLYRGRGNDFIFESGVREACSQSIFQDGDLDQDRRDLQRTTINGGWNYEFGASCRYCNSDDFDPDPPKPSFSPALPPAFSPFSFSVSSSSSAPSISPTSSPVPTHSLAPSLTLSTTPTSFPTMSPTGSPTAWHPDVISEEISLLEATLQRQLTRKLTQKVNKNRESCFRGSDSTVTVTVEWKDYEETFACYFSE